MQGKKKMKSVSSFIGLENYKLNYKSKECKTRSLKQINESIKNFPNVYQFGNENINKFVLLLRKGVYPYEYVDSWKIFDETSLPNKNIFTANCLLKTLLIKSTHTLKKCLKN